MTAQPTEPKAAPILAALEPLLGRVRAAFPGEPSPFAWLRIRTDGCPRDLLLGARTCIGGGVTLLDWQTAPLAEVFFSCGEGDPWELEIDGRLLSGVLVHRALLGFAHGELVEVVTPTERLVREEAGWVAEPPRSPVVPRDSAARARAATPVEVPLDEVQRAAVERPPGRALLVLGEAGAGKTTVALHRLAHLRRTSPEATRRAGVIVPTEGLRRFTRALCDRLGLEDAEVWLYDRWAGDEARRAFPSLPARESQDAGTGVLRLKRHPALGVALAELCRRRPPRHGRARARREDLLHLFGDRVLVDLVVAASGGGVRPSDAAQVIKHTRIQFGETAEQAFAHVDAERLQAVDQRSLDEGTPTEDAGTVDAEDFAPLFELDRLRAVAAGERAASPRPFDCLVLDEAQELAPLELTLIGRAVAPSGTLVVAGDAGQQVDPSAFFADWPTTLRLLDAAEHDPVMLETSYRCPPDVTALGRALLGLAGGMLPTETPRIARARYGDGCHLVAALGDALAGLRADDPHATTAVICRTPAAAKRLARLLGRALTVHLALDGEFDFGPGINVTAVEEVKGLEFDYVVVPDASAAAYPDTPAARRALYVAVTRTVHQLILATVGTWTPLV